MTKHYGCLIAGTVTGVLLGLISTGSTARAQADSTDPEARASDTADPASSSAPSIKAPPSRVESSLFASLFMAGKTQDQFEPLTRKERLKVYADDLFSPFHFFMAGASGRNRSGAECPTGVGTRRGGVWAPICELLRIRDRQQHASNVR